MEQEHEFNDMISAARQELVEAGLKELKTAEDVDSEISNTDGTLLIYVNSMCGCAAMSARPGLYAALENEKKPVRLTTVFAGQDLEATEKAREYFSKFNVPKSSPSFRLFKNGELIWNMQREELLHKDPSEVSEKLIKAFNEHC